MSKASIYSSNVNGHISNQLNPLRFKTALKVAISKLKFVQDKKSALAKQQRRQLADLLKQGKESSASIRVENIIRDDIYVELLEYLELYCELLLARQSMILDASRTTVDPSLTEAVSSVIYAASHSDLKEMTGIKDLLIFKYGPEYGKSAIENVENAVPDKIVSRCVVEPPPETLVVLYLSEIAKAYQVPYSKLIAEEPLADGDTDARSDENGNGGGKALNNDTTANKLDSIGVPANATLSIGGSAQKTTDKDDFDALKARFAALKKG